MSGVRPPVMPGTSSCNDTVNHYGPGEPIMRVRRLYMQGNVEMSENKRILLLALGTLLVLVSDPPVASHSERPHTVRWIATGLAVSAFDSLVRSTLPLSASSEVERTDEILIGESRGETVNIAEVRASRGGQLTDAEPGSAESVAVCKTPS